MYRENSTIGNKVPLSQPKVIFRELGKQEVREYKPIECHPQEQVQACQGFINLFCVPLVRFNGADIKTVKESIGGHQVDYFFCDHPLVKS